MIFGGCEVTLLEYDYVGEYFHSIVAINAPYKNEKTKNTQRIFCTNYLFSVDYMHYSKV